MPHAHGDPEAIAIHKRLIETSRAALVTADFGLYKSCYHLPLFISTWDMNSVFDTDRDLRRIFDGILANFTALGIVRYERYAISAHFIDDTRIEAIHESLLYSKDGLAVPPAVAHTIIQNIDGNWLIAATRYEVVATPILKHAYSSGRALTEEEAADFGLGD